MNLDELKDFLRQVEAQGFVPEEEDEAEPYKAKYAAADALKAELDGLSKSETPGSDQRLQQAILQARRGLVLLETDLLKEGEDSVLAALPTLEGACEKSAADASDRIAVELLPLCQSCYNSLGALWCSRGDFKASLLWLSKAEQLYKGQSAKSKQQNLGTDQSDDAQQSSTISDQVEQGFTQTLFFLAQVHGHAGDKDKSALYCAATLQRQLASGQYRTSDWIQNCLQLGGYYTSVNAFALAQHCIAAAHALAALHTPAKAAAPAGTGDQPQGSTQPPPADADSSLTRSVDAAASNGHAQEETSVQPEGSQAGKEVAQHRAQQQGDVEADVAANLSLATGKLCLGRLAASHAVYVQGHTSLELPYPDSSHFPGLLEFPSLTEPAAAGAGGSSLASQQGIPAPDQLLWGRSALVSSFEDARSLFNEGMTAFNSALSFYTLDGWVTEHTHTLLDVSTMYRLLAGFESSPLRQAAMHKQRTVRLSPVSGDALSREHYLELVRSVELELGAAWRDVMEAAGEGGEGAKGNSKSAMKSVQHYSAFIDTYRSRDGTLPSRIPEPDEPAFLAASFNLGRVLHRCTPSGTNMDMELQTCVKAHRHLSWTAGYVRRHGIKAYQQEAELASELSELLVEKIKLMQRMQAVRSKG